MRDSLASKIEDIIEKVMHTLIKKMHFNGDGRSLVQM